MPNKLQKNSLLLFVLILFLNGCTTFYNPATERRETILINTQDEIALGKDVDAQIKKQLKILKNPLMQQRLDNLGHRVAVLSDRQDITYHFNIVNDRELNAFAVPGGFVYVNKGLMDISTDDELACVLGHEIGHLAARHSVKRIQAQLGYQILISIVLGASGNKPIVEATDIVFNLVNLGYSRQDEFLADKLAVKYAKRAGYNPSAMITFFKKLKKEADKKGKGFNLVFLSSHPPIEERIKRVEDEIAFSSYR